MHRYADPGKTPHLSLILISCVALISHGTIVQACFFQSRGAELNQLIHLHTGQRQSHELLGSDPCRTAIVSRKTNAPPVTQHAGRLSSRKSLGLKLIIDSQYELSHHLMATITVTFASCSNTPDQIFSSDRVYSIKVQQLIGIMFCISRAEVLNIIERGSQTTSQKETHPKLS